METNVVSGQQDAPLATHVHYCIPPRSSQVVSSSTFKQNFNDEAREKCRGFTVFYNVSTTGLRKG
eukprot:scaffold209_cov251-Chaetoceros_neogracile.AAC.5